MTGRNSTTQDEDGWLVSKIKTFHEFDFQIIFGGKNLRCSFIIWWVLGDYYFYTHRFRKLLKNRIETQYIV
jgi:hypothetical protein